MINSFAKNVAKRVQNILNSNGTNLKIDGIFGKETLNAINNVDKKWLIEQILTDRYHWYRKSVQSDKAQIENYKGWINRLNKIAEIVGSKLYFSTTY